MTQEKMSEEERAKKGKSFLINGAIILVVLGILYFANHIYAPNKIAEDYSITTGKLSGLQDRGTRGVKIYAQISYEVKGKNYTADLHMIEPCNFEESTNRSELMGFSYPIIYSNSDPQLAEILTAPEVFERYQLSFPDSLKDIYSKYWNCD